MSETAHPKRTILVVEDDSVLFKSIDMHFRRYGWNSEWYAYAPSSMDEVRSLSVDAALIDINLPAGDGIDLIDRMHDSGVDFPIIVITGDVNAADKVKTGDHGNVQVLMKPFDIQSLRETLSEAMNQAA